MYIVASFRYAVTFYNISTIFLGKPSPNLFLKRWEEIYREGLHPALPPLPFLREGGVGG